MLNVVILNVIMLCVVAPIEKFLNAQIISVISKMEQKIIFCIIHNFLLKIMSKLPQIMLISHNQNFT
jgi:hypothetical protein